MKRSFIPHLDEEENTLTEEQKEPLKKRPKPEADDSNATTMLDPETAGEHSGSGESEPSQEEPETFTADTVMLDPETAGEHSGSGESEPSQEEPEADEADAADITMPNPQTAMTVMQNTNPLPPNQPPPPLWTHELIKNTLDSGDNPVFLLNNMIALYCPSSVEVNQRLSNVRQLLLNWLLSQNLDNNFAPINYQALSHFPTLDFSELLRKAFDWYDELFFGSAIKNVFTLHARTIHFRQGTANFYSRNGFDHYIFFDPSLVASAPAGSVLFGNPCQDKLAVFLRLLERSIGFLVLYTNWTKDRRHYLDKPDPLVAILFSFFRHNSDSFQLPRLPYLSQETAVANCILQPFPNKLTAYLGALRNVSEMDSTHRVWLIAYMAALNPSLPILANSVAPQEQWDQYMSLLECALEQILYDIFIDGKSSNLPIHINSLRSIFEKGAGLKNESGLPPLESLLEKAPQDLKTQLCYFIGLILFDSRQTLNIAAFELIRLYFSYPVLTEILSTHYKTTDKIDRVIHTFQSVTGRLKEQQTANEGLQSIINVSEQPRADSKEGAPLAQIVLSVAAEQTRVDIRRDIQTPISLIEKTRELLGLTEEDCAQAPQHKKPSFSSFSPTFFSASPYKSAPNDKLKELHAAIHAALKSLTAPLSSNRLAPYALYHLKESKSFTYTPGDCLFAAVAQLTGHDTDQLREMTADWILHDPQLRHFIQDLQTTAEGLQLRNREGNDIQVNTIDEYLALLRQPQTWGTSFEIIALSRLLKRPIIILTPQNEFNLVIEEEEYAAEVPIFLFYENGNHFMPLFKQAGVSYDEVKALILANITEKTVDRFFIP